MAISAAHAADTEYLVRKSMTTGYHVLSLITPPAYVVFSLSRYGWRGFSANRLLRATWLGGVGGTVVGGGLGYARYRFSNEEVARKRRLESTYDSNRIRAEDHSAIGSILLAVLTPAILWKRAHTVNLILGGAGIGSSIGLITHYARSLAGDPPPKVAVPAIITA
ncbi:hypothetical protein ARMSODRAFT_946495 [Armillaria solidipes]|uniref:Uncharacterized protein n=1 Tax=Armillaria solidipes TaxID=1076256 RepID=A0A2H3C3L1_9AGAR|nr:hypothetical protein ARMSODRAFT_946495 [Armillaria solidipes]